MFVFNLKLDVKKIIKISIAFFIIISLTLLIIYIYRAYEKITLRSKLTTVDDFIPSNEIAEIDPKNYSNILKLVHKNPDTFVGQKVSFTGYIYRVFDFTKNQFILARDMKITENQSVIVGFVCEADDITAFNDFDWVNIIGTFDKTTYNNEIIPILKIESIEKTVEPKNSAVPKPDDDFVETAVIY